MQENTFNNYYIPGGSGIGLNKNLVICGDSLNILKTIDTESIDLILTSPPYDNLRDYNGYSFDFENIAQELFRVIKIGRCCVWVVNDATINGSESGTSFKQALYFIKIGFRLHDTMIYSKSSFTFPSKNKYHQVFEYMFVFSKDKCSVFNPIKDRKNKYLGERGKSGRKVSGERNVGKSIVKDEFGKRFNIWHYSIGKNNTSKDKLAFQHPAIFPDKLAEDHVVSWSNENDLVLDPFCGSGTSLVAAKKLKRFYIGIDISNKYCEISNQRLNKNNP